MSVGVSSSVSVTSDEVRTEIRTRKGRFEKVKLAFTSFRELFTSVMKRCTGHPRIHNNHTRQ